MGAPTPNARPLVGRALLSSALVMVGLAAACGFGAIPVDPGARVLVVCVLIAAAVADAVVGLRFLQGSK